VSVGTRRLTLLLVRHGQSEWNLAHRIQGQTPHVPLTELGHVQALDAARALAAHRPGALISSDLLRATQTAEHCARLTGLTYSTTPALREQGYGFLEGREFSAAEQVVRSWEPMWAPEGGESPTQLHQRVHGYLHGLYRDPPADVVALAVARGDGPEAMSAVTPANGSVTVLSLAVSEQPSLPCRDRPERQAVPERLHPFDSRGADTLPNGRGRRW
jgi:broad specificity phosphatase PhoE